MRVVSEEKLDTRTLEVPWDRMPHLRGKVQGFCRDLLMASPANEGHSAGEAIYGSLKMMLFASSGSSSVWFSYSVALKTGEADEFHSYLYLVCMNCEPFA